MMKLEMLRKVGQGGARLGTKEYLNLWYLGPTVRLKN